MDDISSYTKNLQGLRLKERTFMFPLVFSICLTMFLFFIDEGYYNFTWMKDPWNWLIFGCYGLGFFIGTAIIAEFTFKSLSGLSKKTIVVVLGLPLGVIFIIAFMYLIMLVSVFTNFLGN